MAMRFGAGFWVQRTGWPELREAVLRCEAAGVDDLWIDDHLLCDEADWHDPKLEGWTTLAAIAAITERPRLGHMVVANTLRNPGLTAKMATTLDHVSGGRMILGIGAAWFRREHEAFGIEFGASPGERLDRLGEAVPLIRRLLDGETVTHEGRFYRFDEALCAPRPVQARLPILVGGSGPRKTIPMGRLGGADACAGLQVPTIVAIRTELPHNPSGKVLKHLLADPEDTSGFVED